MYRSECLRTLIAFGMLPCFPPVGEKARQLLREQGNKKCTSSKHTGDNTPVSLCGSEGGSDSVFTPELSLGVLGTKTSWVDGTKDTPPSLMSPVTPASAGVTPVRFFPQQSSGSSLAANLSSPSVDTPSSLDSGICVAAMASLQERKVQDQNLVNQPLMMSSLFLRQDATNSSLATEYSRVEVVVGDNARAQPVCAHRHTTSNTVERVSDRASNLASVADYSKISSSEDETDGKTTQRGAASTGAATGASRPPPEPVVSAISPMSDISDTEPAPPSHSESSQANKFSNTFKPVALSGYSLATFDASVSLEVIMALKQSSAANKPPTPNTYTMELEEISGDESPELFVADSKAEGGDENGVMTVAGDDMEMSDEDSNGGNVVESGKIEVGGPPVGLIPTTPPGYPPPLMNIPVPPAGFGPTTPPFPPLLPPHAVASLGIPPPPLPVPGFPFPQGVPPPLLGSSYPPYLPPPLHLPQPPLLEESLKMPSSHVDKKQSDTLKREVLKEAMTQMTEVLMRDLQRKYIDTIGRTITDKHWELQQQQMKLRAPKPLPAKPSADEPYRRMLVPAGDLSEKALSTSSHSSLKRLTKFRIPTISRGSARGSQVLVVRKSESDRQSQAKSTLYSDLSSVDSGSDWEDTVGDEEEREEKAAEVSVEEEYDTQPGEDVLSSMSESSASELEEEDEGEEADSAMDVIKSVEDTVEDRNDEEYLPVPFEKKKPKKTLHVADVFSDSEEEGMDIDVIGNGIPEVVDASLLPHIEKADASVHLSTAEKRKADTSVALRQDQSLDLPSSLSSPPLLPPQFSKRSSNEEQQILSSLLLNGPDKEDIQMMRLALIRMRQEGNLLAKRTHWAYYPGLLAEAPPAVKRRRLSSMDVTSQQHQTGCARSEGYYKIDAFAKKGYVTSIGVQQTGPAATKEQIEVKQVRCMCVLWFVLSWRWWLRVDVMQSGSELVYCSD